jgi:nucleoside-diphosphate-sugar epimerase
MILVTGADGIVGRAVCVALRQNNIDYIPVVRSKKHRTEKHAVIFDISNDDSFNAFKNLELDCIIHLAAAVPHSSHYPDTEKSADITRSIDRNIFKLQSSFKVPLIYMSSCGLYDRKIDTIKTEDDVSLLKIESPYFKAKLDGEMLFSQNPDSTILRLSAPVGEGLKPLLVLSRFIVAAREGNREQNFIDAKDVSSLILEIIKKPGNTILNVAGREPVTMLKLAETVINVIDNGDISFSEKIDPREGETANYSLDKVKKLYNWCPEISLTNSIKLIANEDFSRNT